jgi:hypothetical protein
LAAIPIGCVDTPDGLGHDLEVVAFHPPDGSAAVPLNTDPIIVFNTEIPDQVEFEITLYRGNVSNELNCHRTDDPTVLECPLSKDLRTDSWYRIDVDIAANGEVDAESIWTTSTPDGLAYDIGPSLTVERLGGNDAAVTLLEDLLLDGDDHLVLVMDRFYPGLDNLPWEGNWLLGNARIRENLKTGEMEAVIDETDGMTISTRGQLQSDGGFVTESDYASLPVSVDGESLQLALEGITLSGNIPIEEHDYQKVRNVTLTAAIPKYALDHLAETVPEWARLVADVTGLIELDVDLDGDGIQDAATFQLTSTGDRIILADAR